MILGIDEVGRGAWAGPLVVGACVLNGAKIEGLTDSKALSKKQREKLSAEISESSAIIGLGWVSNDELDEIGLSAALKLATRLAVKEVQLKCKKQNIKFNEIIIDGTINFLAGTPLEKYASTLKKADLLISSVSAAAICAKVARDNFMTELSKKPEFAPFCFENHAGYGTSKHRAALYEFGVSKIHRKSFKPIAEFLEKHPKVKRVLYPGLPNHPGHELMKKQDRGFGAMISFDVESGEEAKEILKRIQLIYFAESLGGTESLLTYPLTQTHADVPKEILAENGIYETTLRLSVGIEDAEDLIADLKQALG